MARGRPGDTRRAPAAEATARLTFAADLEAPRAARAALPRVDGFVGEAREIAALLVSELVTNSVRHAGLDSDGEIEVSIASGPDGLRVEVADGGPGPLAAIVEPGPEADGGRGLFIVARLARRWGIENGRVWFELDRPPEDPTAVQPRGG